MIKDKTQNGVTEAKKWDGLHQDPNTVSDIVYCLIKLIWVCFALKITAISVSIISQTVN